MSQGFNHFDENGNAVMVDVSGKNITYRTAVATGEIHVGEAIMEAVKEGSVKKGDVLGVARVAAGRGGVYGKACKHSLRRGGREKLPSARA